MFTNLLVPLNGNPAATTALRTAHALATAPSAHLNLLQVIRPPVAMIDSRADQIREAAGYLDGVARELNTGDVSVSTHVRSGDVADEILTAIDDLRADVVVIPTRGHSGMVRAVLRQRSNRDPLKESHPSGAPSSGWTPDQRNRADSCAS